MKPFNLKEYLAKPSRKVVTRDGRPVRIICTDHTEELPIVASFHDALDDRIVHCALFDSSGRRASANRVVYSMHDTPEDLFFVEQKHVGFVSIVRSDSRVYVVNKIFDTEEEALESQIHKRDYAGVGRIEWTE